MGYQLFARRRPPAPTVPSGPPRAGHCARPLTPLQPEDDLGKVVHRLQQQSGGLPVVADGWLVGWVTEPLVAEYLDAPDATGNGQVADVMAPVSVAVDAHVPMADLPAIFREHDRLVLPVVLSDGRYLGCLTWADAMAAQMGRPTPPRLGGMATPLGVYLYSALASGGASNLGLVLTGVVMASLLWVAQMSAVLGTAALYHATRLPLFLGLYQLLNDTPVAATPLVGLGLLVIEIGVLMGVFLVLLRIAPGMAGIHAAEHQTVNAIEAGEPLTLEAVGRMSRVHPRCGTNLWGLMSLTYLGILALSVVLSTREGRGQIATVGLLAFWWVLFVVATWQRVGGWFQQHFTTRPPTPAQLVSGLRAGAEVLARHQAAQALGITPSRFQRVWRIGLAQVALGLVLSSFLLGYLAQPLDDWCRSLVK